VLERGLVSEKFIMIFIMNRVHWSTRKNHEYISLYVLKLREYTKNSSAVLTHPRDPPLSLTLSRSLSLGFVRPPNFTNTATPTYIQTQQEALKKSEPLLPLDRSQTTTRLVVAPASPTAAHGMDDHHQQPIWPMIQGAANYAWNLIEEVWTMVWRPRVETSGATTSTVPERDSQIRSEMKKVETDKTVTIVYTPKT